MNSIFSFHSLDQKMMAKLDIFLGFFGTFFGQENFEMSAVSIALAGQSSLLFCGS